MFVCTPHAYLVPLKDRTRVTDICAYSWDGGNKPMLSKRAFST